MRFIQAWSRLDAYANAWSETHREAYAIAAGQFAVALGQLETVAGDLAVLEDRAETAGAPWTPGRLPTWKPEGR